MKKKFFSFILAIAMFIPCMFMLTACGGGKNPPDDQDPSGHTHIECPTCELCTDPDCDGSANEKCQGHLPPAEPAMQLMEDYFSGIKISYKKESFSDRNYHSATFEELLDNQIDVLAQDILYRLSYVYGANGNERNSVVGTGDESNNILKDIDGNIYADYNTSNKAMVDVEALITSTNTHNAEHTLTNLDINCLDCLQMAIDPNSVPVFNYLYNQNFMNLMGAIDGKNTFLAVFMLNNPSTAGENAWINWNSANNSTYANVLSTYKTTLKLEIAKIMANTQTGTYDELLTKIDSLNFENASQFTTSVANAIYNNIIGSALVQKDNTIANCQYFQNSSIITDSFLLDAPYDDGKETFTNEEIEFSPRLYKAYSKIVPAIIEQALANTFESTTTSIYSGLNRYAVESTNNAMGYGYTKNYESVVLMQKANTLMTKLVVNLAEATSVSAQVNVVINGVDHKTTITLIQGENTIDLNTLTSGATLSAYNGNSFNDTETNLFGTAPTGTNNNGNNYIELSFDGTQAFQISFSGYYDKNS